MPRCGILEFGHSGGSHLECAGLTALCWPAALTQAPTADASKNSQQAFQVITKRAFQERSQLFGSRLGALSSQRQ